MRARPKTHKHRLLIYSIFAATGAALLFPANTQAAGKYAAGTSAIEIAQLPKYCYAQYVDENLSNDPVYSIQGCGYAMNHFCPALVSLMRARKYNIPKSERIGYANQVIYEVKYTLRDMTPTCSIRSDVLSAGEQAQNVLRMLNSSR